MEGAEYHTLSLFSAIQAQAVRILAQMFVDDHKSRRVFQAHENVQNRRSK